jgi:hypothetical protein
VIEKWSTWLLCMWVLLLSDSRQLSFLARQAPVSGPRGFGKGVRVIKSVVRRCEGGLSGMCG